MTTRTGPQYYPAANHTLYNYEDSFSVTPMEVNVCLLHTTEGTTVPTYAVGGKKGADAPNLTAMPNMSARRLDWYQHFRIDSSARALENRAGGVETNTNNVVQVELVGTCDPAHAEYWNGLIANVDYIFWPAAPQWALDDVADFIAWLHEEHGVPLVAASQWLAYPASYGNTSARMSFAEWNAFRGVCGHQHVPENVHGDPGNIKIAWIMELAKKKAGDIDRPNGPGAPTPTKPKPAVPPFPGRKYFGQGQVNQYVTQLGAQLVRKGFNRFHDGDGYQPGPRWTDYDRKNLQAFQRSRKELSGDADGYPGPLTWKLLFS